jgi:hypothetical protein
MAFTNKHLVIAIIVAPVLAVLAWLGAGQFAGETPAPAVPGEVYPLVEKSNCRYSSGSCDLENENFSLTLSPGDSAVGAELVLRSSHPLDGVVLGVGKPEDNSAPAVMRRVGGQGLEWRLELPDRPQPGERIRLVAVAGGSSYFADAATAFFQRRQD